MRTRSRSVALVLFDEVEVLDVAGLAQALSMAGRSWNWRAFTIHALARQPGLIRTRSQIELSAPVPLGALTAPELILVPGGYGARLAANDPDIVGWLSAAAATASHLAAIGWGVLPLARAGLLHGRRFACQPAVRDAVLEVEPTASPVDARSARDGSLLTARESGAALELGVLLIEQVLGAKHSKSVAAELGLVQTGSGAGAAAAEAQRAVLPNASLASGVRIRSGGS